MSDSMNQIIDVAYVETEVNIENKTTEQLTAEVNVRYRQAEALAGMSLQMLADAGMRLIEIKNRIPHGQFEDWCAEHLEFSKSKAEKMMKLADRMSDETSLFSKTETFTDIGISRVWALLAAPEEVAAEVIETHDVTDMTVRELKEEISRLKNEKSMAENNNDSLRKEVHHLQGQLAEAFTQEDMNQISKDFARREDELQQSIREGNEREADIQAKLDKARADLKKQKDKLKEIEASKDEEIQKRLAEAGTELEEKARADAQKETEKALKEKTEAIQSLETQVSALEAEKAKLSNTALMEFKVYVDQLQDIYWKINEIISEQNEEAPDVGAKMQGALQKIVEAWRP